MQEGFIRGSAGEVRLLDILPERLQGSFLSRETQEKEAADYESKHPNVLVIRPFEEVPDGLIPQLEPDERKRVLADKAALKERRELRAKNKAEESAPEMGGDPDRMGKELKRRRIELEGLTLDHPDYDRLFANLVKVINQLEDACGVERTKYAKGETIAKKADAAVPPELMVKIEKYLTKSRKIREASIIAGENPALIRLIRDRETEPELQELAVQRLMQLEAL